MSTALLDVNVLVSLFDPGHPNHGEAHAWFETLGRGKWATCPLTQNGCVRIISQPGYPVKPVTAAEVAGHLKLLCAAANHESWPDDLSLLDEARFDLKKLQGPNQLTDVYLLGLAVRHQGHLVTFDRSIPWRAVRGAKPGHLRVLGGS